MSSASGTVLSGTQSQTAKNFPHCQHGWIPLRGLDRFSGFPFRDLDDRAVARAHDGPEAIRHQPFLAQRRNTLADKLEKLVFLSGFGPVSYDCAYAVH